MVQIDKQSVHLNQVEFYENTIRELRHDLENSASQIKTLKEKAAEPSSLLIHLQKELIDVKVWISSTVYQVVRTAWRQGMNVQHGLPSCQKFRVYFIVLIELWDMWNLGFNCRLFWKLIGVNVTF